MGLESLLFILQYYMTSPKKNIFESGNIINIQKVYKILMCNLMNY